MKGDSKRISCNHNPLAQRRSSAHGIKASPPRRCNLFSRSLAPSLPRSLLASLLSLPLLLFSLSLLSLTPSFLSLLSLSPLLSLFPLPLPLCLSVQVSSRKGTRAVKKLTKRNLKRVNTMRRKVCRNGSHCHYLQEGRCYYYHPGTAIHIYCIKFNYYSLEVEQRSAVMNARRKKRKGRDRDALKRMCNGRIASWCPLADTLSRSPMAVALTSSRKDMNPNAIR